MFRVRHEVKPKNKHFKDSFELLRFVCIKMFDVPLNHLYIFGSNRALGDMMSCVCVSVCDTIQKNIKNRGL